MSLNRLKRRIAVVSTVWSALSKVDAMQTAADKSEAELSNAREAEKRAADRATQAAKVHGVTEAAAAAQEAKLLGLNPFAGVAERS